MRKAHDRGRRSISPVNSRPALPFLFFCESLLNRFLSKIYIYICISVYVCLIASHFSLSLFHFLSLWLRFRSATQRSSLTYGYSNDQGTLDGSDMESLSRRCPPSESTVSIFHSLPPLPPVSSSTIARDFSADNRVGENPSGFPCVKNLLARPALPSRLLLVNFRHGIVERWRGFQERLLVSKWRDGLSLPRVYSTVLWYFVWSFKTAYKTSRLIKTKREKKA